MGPKRGGFQQCLPKFPIVENESHFFCNFSRKQLVELPIKVIAHRVYCDAYLQLFSSSMGVNIVSHQCWMCDTTLNSVKERDDYTAARNIKNTVWKLKISFWPDESWPNLSFQKLPCSKFDVDFFWHLSQPKALRTELTCELPVLNLSQMSILLQTCNLKEMKRWVLTVADMTHLFFTLLFRPEIFKVKRFVLKTF